LLDVALAVKSEKHGHVDGHMSYLVKECMTQNRYPVGLSVTAEDFQSSDWRSALHNNDVEEFGYSSLWTALSKIAQSASENGQQAHAKVLWLLADSCSMMLRPASLNEPFKPFAVFHDRRSAMPEDFSKEDLSFFAEIMDIIDDTLLRARIADLLWLVGKPRHTKHASAAIDEYIKVPLNTKAWPKGGRECWERAFALLPVLKKDDEGRTEGVQKKVLDRLLSATTEEKFFGVELAKLLRKSKPSKAVGSKVAQTLETLGRSFEELGDIYCSRAFFEEGGNWFGRLGMQEKQAEMTAAKAESYFKEAAFQTAGSTPFNMVANGLYEKAIQIFREIPGRLRPAFRVDERIEELRKLQSQTGQRVNGEMGVIRSPGVDITDIVDQARKAVSGLSAIDALGAFANIQRIGSVDILRENVLGRMRDFPLQWIFESTTFSRDGRVIAKRPAIGLLGAEISENDEKAIQSSMVRDHAMFIGIAVQSTIFPALEVVQSEHRIREADLVELSRNSPIVPNDRGTLFSKALYAGYDGDFATALHLLVPQMEHMLRVHLKQAGATTTNLDRDGIENENGLSTLIALPQVESIFGKDLVFEIKSLFCDPFGPNLRNELAHGLIGDEDCQSPAVIYAWWLSLNLVFNSWWGMKEAGASSEVNPTGE